MKNSLSSITKHFTFKYGPSLRPSRDWGVLLALVALFIGVSLGLNLWQFSKVTNGLPVGDATSTPPMHALPTDSISKFFDTRAREQSLYKNGYHFVDPSIRPR